jgi:hypothetical protein
MFLFIASIRLVNGFQVHAASWPREMPSRDAGFPKAGLAVKIDPTAVISDKEIL